MDAKPTEPGADRGSWGLFAGAVLAACLVLAGFAVLGTPLGNSGLLNLSWYAQVEPLILGGSLPPRHLPDMWEGLGGLDFFFYAPLPFYAAALIARPLCWGCGTDTVFALSGGIAFVLASLAFYRFARLFLPAAAALAGAVAYALLPYHLMIDWVWRQAVGEVWAYVFLPLLALGFERLTREGRGGAVFALSFAALALSHLPSALLAVHVLAVLFVIRAWGMRRERGAVLAGLLRLALYGALGAGIAAIGWLPALALLGDVSPEALYLPFFEAERWLYGLSFDFPNIRLAVAVALTAAMAGALAFAGVVAAGDRLSPQARLWILAPVLIGAFLMSVLSQPLWTHWVIDRVQFPWRIMIFVDLAGALGAGALFAAAQAGGWRRWLGLAGLGGLVAVIALHAAVLTPRPLAQAGSVRDPVPAFGVAEYIPPQTFAILTERQAEAELDVWITRPVMAEIAAEAAARSTGVAALETAARRLTITPEPGADLIRLAVPYWRHWQAGLLEKVPVRLSPDPELGMIEIRAEGAGGFAPSMVLILPWHWSEWAGAALSAVSLLLLAGLAIGASLRARRVHK